MHQYHSTHAHDDGALVENMLIKVYTLRNHYPDKVQHLAQTFGS